MVTRNKCILPLTLGSLSTRAKRRKALNTVLKELNKIRDAEEAYLERIPNNLTGSAAYNAADECVDILTDVIVSLMDIFYPARSPKR
ncbi:MAG TPA: hypothetical protein DD738_00400 [Ruminiclostridium sp.]|nr:hypothetical protein [Ruminiclostridium sp.]